MRRNYGLNDDGYIYITTEFPLDEEKPIIDFDDGFDFSKQRFYKVTDGVPSFDEEAYQKSLVVIPPPDPIGDLQTENRTLKAQFKAVTESNSFLEECIVEMARIIYA